MSKFSHAWTSINPSQTAAGDLRSVESARRDREKFNNIPILVRLRRIVAYLKGQVEAVRVSPDSSEDAELLIFEVNCRFGFPKKGSEETDTDYPTMTLSIRDVPDRDVQKENSEVFQTLVQIYMFSKENNLVPSAKQGEILSWDRERIEVENRVRKTLMAFSNRGVNKDTESRIVAALMLHELEGFKFLGLEKRKKIESEVIEIPDNEEYVASFSRNETNAAHTLIDIKVSDVVEL